MPNKNLIFKISICLLVFLNILSLTIFSYSLGKSTYAKQSTAKINDSGKIQVQVLEANTNKPIDSATICVIETRHYENTNKYGMSTLISVPIIRNTNFDISLERSWGEITLLVYKNGYADNISFYRKIMPGSTRVGIVVHLSPIISESDNKIEVSLENPNEIWIKSLIQIYKKRI